MGLAIIATPVLAIETKTSIDELLEILNKRKIELEIVKTELEIEESLELIGGGFRTQRGPLVAPGGSSVGAMDDLTDVTLTSTSTGDMLYNDATGQWVNLGVGTNGYVLTLASGLPSWAVSTGGGSGGGSGFWASSTDNLSIYNDLSGTRPVVVIGGTATTTEGFDFEVINRAYIPYVTSTLIESIDFEGNFLMDYETGATYKNLQDWFTTTQSAGKIDGGEFGDNGDGTATIAAGRGIFKTSNISTSTAKFGDWTASSSVGLVDNETNYIYVENGATPEIKASTTKSDANNRNKILLRFIV